MRSRVLIAAFGLLLGLAGVATALQADKVTALKAATDAFLVLAKDSGNTGNAPRQTNPEVARLLDLILNTSELVHDNAVPFAQLTPLNEWNLSVIKVLQVYTLAGTGIADIGALQNNPAAIAKSNENTAAFAPELGRAFDAMLWLQATVLDSVQGFVASASPQQLENPNVKTGLGQIRAGAAQTLYGVLTTFQLPNVKDDWREARLRAILAIAPKTAKFVAPADREVLRKTAADGAAASSSAKVKAAFETVAKSLAP